jgi:outer membrane beta-barrel protein
VVLALAFGLTTASTALAAPAGGKPPDNPFDERSAGSEAAGEAETRDQPREQTKKPPAESSNASAPARDEPVTTDAEEPGDDSAGQKDQDEEEEEREEREGSLHALACLEGDTADGKRKGVQRRDFLKKHRFEIGALGGWYASDALSSTYSYGGALAFYPSEDFGLEVLVTRTPMKFRLEEPFNAFDAERHFTPSVAYQGVASLLWSPIHAKFKFTEATIVHGDIFVLAGAGRTFHESVLGLTWEAGFGLKLYFSRFVTFRLEARDFLIPQEVLGRGRSTNNITILGGLSFWLG